MNDPSRQSSDTLCEGKKLLCGFNSCTYLKNFNDAHKTTLTGLMIMWKAQNSYALEAVSVKQLPKEAIGGIFTKTRINLIFFHTLHSVIFMAKNRQTSLNFPEEHWEHYVCKKLCLSFLTGFWKLFAKRDWFNRFTGII